MEDGTAQLGETDPQTVDHRGKEFGLCGCTCAAYRDTNLDSENPTNVEGFETVSSIQNTHTTAMSQVVLFLTRVFKTKLWKEVIGGGAVVGGFWQAGDGMTRGMDDMKPDDTTGQKTRMFLYHTLRGGLYGASLGGTVAIWGPPYLVFCGIKTVL